MSHRKTDLPLGYANANPDMEEWSMDYDRFLASFEVADYGQQAEWMAECLPIEWFHIYRDNQFVPNQSTDIVNIPLGSFSYIFDSRPPDALPHSEQVNEPRLVAAYGISDPQPKKRDDYRLKGWAGPTEKTFGKIWDKGHFIAHSIGGRVDNQELNVFPQLRKLNRGWSGEGKRFRKMEQYCSSQNGLFCFHRPVYLDLSCIPAFLEFGILLPEGAFWVETFNNQAD